MRPRLLTATMVASLLVVACSEGDVGPPGPRGDTDHTAGGDALSGDRAYAGDAAPGGDARLGGDEGGSTTALLPPSQSPILTYCPFSDASDLTSFEGRPVVRVCHAGDGRTGCDVDTIAAAIAAANDGDRIEIVGDGAAYQQCTAIPAGLEGIEIIGVCGTPRLENTVCESKGLFVNYGRDITITNVEISGLAISAGLGGNAAAVRDQSQGNLALRYVYFHHNQNGVLGGAGVVTIDWSKFEANGSAVDPGYTHNIYMSADVDELVVRNSLFLRASNEGNNLKSRAQAMHFECSVSASLDGVDSREMDISEGGDVVILNSLVEQGPPSANSNLIGFATESTNPDRRHAVMTLVVRNSLLINDRGSGSFIAYNAFNGFTLVLDGVHFVGSGTALTNSNGGTEDVTQTGVESFSDRSAAGLPAYSTDHTQLPPPPGCPQFEYF